MSATTPRVRAERRPVRRAAPHARGGRIPAIQVISTGLFEHDLDAHAPPGRPLPHDPRSRNGDRLVADVAWRILQRPEGRAIATPEQANDQGDLLLLADPTSWLRRARGKTRRSATFVPSRFQVRLRVFPDHGDGPDVTVGEREVAPLPAPAGGLLRWQATELDPAGYEVTTEDARAFAEALIEAGREPFDDGPWARPRALFARAPRSPRELTLCPLRTRPASRRGGLPWARVMASHERLPNVRPARVLPLVPHE